MAVERTALEQPPGQPETYWRKWEAERTEAFVNSIKGLDKGPLAELKRNAGETLTSARHVNWMWRYLPHSGDFRTEVAFLVATLLPFDRPFLQGEGRPQDDLGGTLRRFKSERGREQASVPRGDDKGKEAFHPVDRRLNILLDSSALGADVSELAFRLRQTVHLILQKHDPALSLNWAGLLADLWHWKDERKPVQKRWAKSYYGWKADDNKPSEDAPHDAPDDTNDDKEQ